jgi:hypothetical protein
METITKRINQNAFFARLARAVAVLCMPGLGYDTYRLSETLLLGWLTLLITFILLILILIFDRSSMPVIEKGVGLDRTMYKLPVGPSSLSAPMLSPDSLPLFLLLAQALVVDDFADVTPDLVYSAYVEAVYREEEWEYERLTLPFWKKMMRNASETQSSDAFFHHFPLKSGETRSLSQHFSITSLTSPHFLLGSPLVTVLTGFIRPQFPFDCEAMGGCGPEVTARMPKEYCAIDVHRDWRTYKFGHFLRRRF